MKVLEKLRFSEFTELNDREMKLTFGGSGSSGTACTGLGEETCRQGDSCIANGVSGHCAWVRVQGSCGCATISVG